jgi:hypothetical protein
MFNYTGYSFEVTAAVSMLQLRFLPLLSFFLLLRRAVSQSQSSYFTNPKDAGDAQFYSADQVWNLNSQQNITWITNLQSYGIWIWQQNVGGGATIGDEIYSESAW